MKLDPHNHITPTHESVQQLLVPYDLELVSFVAATSGIENTTLIVDCTKSKFVLRVYRKHNKDNTRIELESRFASYLHKHEVRVPQITPNAAGEQFSLVELDDTVWQVMLMEFVPGQHADSYSEQLLQEMAAAQAKMHFLANEFDGESLLPPILEHQEGVFLKQIDFGSLINSELIEFLERAKTFHTTLDSSLPTGLCHLDYDRDNILSDKDGGIAAILDFDDLAPAPFVLDLGYTLWEIWYTNNKEAADRYLILYEQLRPLSKLEKDSLAATLLFRHYVICSAGVVKGEIDNETIKKYVRLEKEFMATRF